MDERAAREKLSEISRKYGLYEGYVRFLAGEAKKRGLWKEYGEKLSSLYLRLKQGPIRMAVIGESSTGKSTLINAFAGDFVAPENAGVCTAQPIYMMRHDEPGTFVRPYSPTEGGLPEVREVWGTARLLTRQYGAKAAKGVSGGVQPFVYVSGGAMPRGVTIVDTPGLNAASADTETTFGLFEHLAYAPEGVRDVPEIILYVTRQHNLLQTEQDAIVRMRELGADMNSCFLVHNDFQQAYTVTPESFEKVSEGALEGLSKSLAALMGEDAPAPEAQPAEDYDAWNFDSYLEDEDDGRDERVFSLNAMLARMQYVTTDDGVYNVLKYPPEGMTVEEFTSWKALNAEDTTQNQLALVRDLWVEQGHSGYAPMLSITQAVERRALELAEQGDGLCDVLSAADALGEALLKDCVRHMERSETPVGREDLDALRGLIIRAKDVIAAFAAEDGAFAAGVREACEAPQVAVVLHNSKVDLTIDSIKGKKFSLLDLGSLFVGVAYPIAWLVPLARYLLRDDLPKRYGKLIKDRGLGGRDLDALFDGTPSAAGVGALVQIISDLAAPLSEELRPDMEQMQMLARDGIAKCQQAIDDANSRMIEIETEFIDLMKLPAGRALRTETSFFDGERATKAFAERIAYLHPELELPEQDELGERVRGLMYKMKNSGAVTMFNAKNRVYEGIVCSVIREAVEALRMPLEQPDCGVTAMIDALAKPVRAAWRELFEEMNRAYDALEKTHSARTDEQAQQLKAKRAELAAQFEQAKSGAY